jgi:enoyl-CoA hydratase
VISREKYESIVIEKRENGVAVATLNRPEKLNAVDGRLHWELAHLWPDVGSDPEIRVLVVTGAGRAFCAGGDFSAARRPSPGGPDAMMREARQIVDNLLDLEKPVISAVRGYAMGLGATVALLCDIVIAGRQTTFADTHVNMGIGAGDGGQVIWPLLIGVNRAKYHLMTGDRLAAPEAFAFGLVNAVVDEEEVLPRALAIADRLAAGPAQAISASKVPINKYIKMVSNLVLPLSLNLEEASMASDDAKEARLAFQEKRPPRFAGAKPRVE